MIQHEPLTTDKIELVRVETKIGYDSGEIRFIAFKSDVLSALEGLKNIRYYYVEDSAVCSVCGETGFIFTFVEGENPIVSYTCPKCHVDKWFPFARMAGISGEIEKTSEDSQGGSIPQQPLKCEHKGVLKKQ